MTFREEDNNDYIQNSFDIGSDNILENDDPEFEFPSSLRQKIQ